MEKERAALPETRRVRFDGALYAQILDMARRDAEFISVGKLPGKGAIRQQEINRLLIERVQSGERVCRLKGGDPFIFGRGGEEIEALEQAGLPWEAVPGITAATACAAAAGIPLTHRQIARSVTLITASTADDAEPDWSALATAEQTVVFYMGLTGLNLNGNHPKKWFLIFPQHL